MRHVCLFVISIGLVVETCVWEALDLRGGLSGRRQVSSSIAARNSLYGLEVQKNQPPWLVGTTRLGVAPVPALTIQVPEHRLC